MSEKYRSIDLFAGIGGIRKGFEQAFKSKIETIFVSEWDEYAKKTYRANFKTPPEEFFKGDITKVNEADIRPFDICLAGFPCQAFSIAGHKEGFEDTRGTLFFDVARICEYHKPMVIFCENVKGLLNHDKGRTFKVIKKTLENLGYTVYHDVLKSSDFGVPQIRERVYIVAFRNDIDSSSFRFPQGKPTKKTIRDIMEEDTVPTKYYISTQYQQSMINHKKRHEAKGNGFGYVIRSLDEYAGTIVCGGMGRERNLIIDERITDFTPTTHIKGTVSRDCIRRMTPREWARLQGFPDTFKLPLADVHSYKQLGNSVTVPVIKAIAKNIKEVLDNA